MRTILVIEDDVFVRDNIQDLLKGEGFFVLIAEDGREGLEMALHRQPDLILCDVMMPHMDGHQVLRLLRADPRSMAIPFIFLTAKASHTDIRAGMDLGADDYLVKPFTADELLRAVQTRLDKHDEQGRWYRHRIDELRNNLSRNLPHELRTPLSSILGYSQFLLEIYDTVDPQELNEMLMEIHRSGKRLERLVENYHLYAQLEIATTDPIRRTALLNMGDSSAEAVIGKVAHAQAVYRGRESDMQLDLEEAGLRIQSDYLEKIAEELIDNAFKFSDQGSPVFITGTCSESVYVLEVVDEGRGVRQESLGNIGAFIQFDRDKHEQQGLGLGLTITRRLAELHGGLLNIESNPAEGMCVKVYLPLADKE